mmetsp:Transcript_16107/g.22497  ORF Transcript_16107/g.22497 Transcript_16107/m.22497 type:complete len:84 (-) Transcript_16107:322-573(-)
MLALLVSGQLTRSDRIMGVEDHQRHTECKSFKDWEEWCIIRCLLSKFPIADDLVAALKLSGEVAVVNAMTAYSTICHQFRAST